MVASWGVPNSRSCTGRHHLCTQSYFYYDAGSRRYIGRQHTPTLGAGGFGRGFSTTAMFRTKSSSPSILPGPRRLHLMGSAKTQGRCCCRRHTQRQVWFGVRKSWAISVCVGGECLPPPGLHYNGLDTAQRLVARTPVSQRPNPGMRCAMPCCAEQVHLPSCMLWF